MTDWHVAACVRMSECVCGGMCECCQSHPRHTNVINKVKLLLLREQQKKEYTHTYTHMHRCTQRPTCMHKNTKVTNFFHAQGKEWLVSGCFKVQIKLGHRRKEKTSNATFHHIFSLPRGWLCYTLSHHGEKEGSIPVKHFTKIELQLPKKKRKKKTYKSSCVFVNIFSHLSTFLQRFSRPLIGAQLLVCCCWHIPTQAHMPPITLSLVSAPRTATQRRRFMNTFQESLKQRPCFGAQRETPSL